MLRVMTRENDNDQVDCWMDGVSAVIPYVGILPVRQMRKCINSASGMAVGA
jgi:hypothetical protein